MATTNGRYGGGAGGKENRYHFPAVDTAKWDQATVGADTGSQWQQTGTTRMQAAQTNTMASGRGVMNGCDYPDNCWKSAF